MHRIKVMSKGTPNTYRWFNDARTAHMVAYTIVKNKDAEVVEVENLKEKKIEKIYKRGLTFCPGCATIQSEREKKRR